jgi:hypothetical protein
MSINDIIKQSRPILNENIELMLEGRMEDELVAQLGKWYKTKNRTRDLDDTQKDEISVLAKSILDVDPTKKKSWRFKIKDWIISNEIKLPEDTGSLKQELTYHMNTNSQKMDFNKRSDLSEFIANIKKNRGIVDEIFNYEFEIDYSDDRFIIYVIQNGRDEKEFKAKLADCTSWCIASSHWGEYSPPYYLLIDKKEKTKYAIVPGGAQFRDPGQNVSNSEKRFEEFDKILDLRNRYYFKIAPRDIGLMDHYIYEHPSFEKSDDKVKLAILGLQNATFNSDGTIDVDGDIDITDKMVDNGKFKYKFGNVSGDFSCSANELTSLEGAPTEVGGDFSCSANELTSLEGAPTEVGGAFICSVNNLTSLNGSPKEVGGIFYCKGNPDLKSLDGIGNVSGDIFSDIQKDT